MINDFASRAFNGQQIQEALPALGLGALISPNGLRFPDLPPAIRGGDSRPEQRSSDPLESLDDASELLVMVDANLSTTDRVVAHPRQRAADG